MTEPHGTYAGRADASNEEWTSSSEHHPEIDWVAAERSPEFRQLVKKKNAFVVPATIFFLAWYTGFVLLCGYAPASSTRLRSGPRTARSSWRASAHPPARAVSSAVLRIPPRAMRR